VAGSSIDINAWTATATADLLNAQQPDGGWAYQTGQAPATEPTALAILALSQIQPDAEALAAAADWLVARQRGDGLFTASAVHEEGSWLSPLAALTLQQRGRTAASRAAEQAILDRPVYTFSDLLAPGTYGYDTRIPGWPWTAGDFSFTEPTSLAMIFLKKTSNAAAGRVREGARFLRDRALPGGGWNYGEPPVLGGALFPTVAPTALALLALADERDETTAAAESWLCGQVGQIPSLMSLGWAAIALNVLGLLDDAWQSAAVNRWSELPTGRRGPMETSLCLLGVVSADEHPLGVP